MERYVLTLDLYMYEPSEAKAKEKAKEYIETLQGIDDNKAEIISIHKQEFGKLESKKIEL